MRIWTLAAISTLACMTGPTVLGDVSAEVKDKIAAAAPDKPQAEPAEARRVLVFSKTNGFRHRSIPVGIEAIKTLGEKTGAFEVVATEEVAHFAKDKLETFDAVIMLNTTGDVFWPFQKGDKTRRTPEQLADAKALQATYRENLKQFVEGGGGLVGIHAATDTCYKWKTYGQMMGGYFSGHPWGAGSTVFVKIDDQQSPLTKMFDPAGFKIKDEIYQFTEKNRAKQQPYSRDKQRVLISLDEEKTDVKRGGREDNDYAISWVKSVGKGRVFYCSLGHNDHVYWTPEVVRHYLAGIQFAIGDLDAPVEPVPLKQAAANNTPIEHFLAQVLVEPTHAPPAAIAAPAPCCPGH